MGDAFVGRGLELSMLETCLAEARGGSGRLAWISGEAGIGKTRLAEELQRRVRDAIKKIAQHDATLGRHLELSVRTGVFCVYAPTWPD